MHYVRQFMTENTCNKCNDIDVGRVCFVTITVFVLSSADEHQESVAGKIRSSHRYNNIRLGKENLFGCPFFFFLIWQTNLSCQRQRTIAVAPSLSHTCVCGCTTTQISYYTRTNTLESIIIMCIHRVKMNSENDMFGTG
jgi:hypothetical protein